MNEENIVKEKKTKISKLVILSLLFGPMYIYFLLAVAINLIKPFYQPFESTTDAFILIALFASAPAGFILGVIALIKIKKSKGLLKGIGLARSGIIISAVMTLLLFYHLFLFLQPKGKKFYPMTCGTNLTGLGKAILIYANDYDGKYPTADKWCDLLIIYSDVEPSLFVCKGSDAKVGESSYALNSNLAGRNLIDFPPETVVLFETNLGKESFERDDLLENRQWYKILNTKAYSRDFSWIKKYKSSNGIYKDRWNQAGGQEILTIENHEDKGCFVLFNDYHVDFIKTEEIGDLKWSNEENNN